MLLAFGINSKVSTLFWRHVEAFTSIPIIKPPILAMSLSKRMWEVKQTKETFISNRAFQTRRDAFNT